MNNGRFVKPIIDDRGYEVVILHDRNNREVLRYVHELVAETFVPNPHNKKYVRHKDGNLRNNNADNLEWVDDPE